MITFVFWIGYHPKIIITNLNCKTSYKTWTSID